MRVYHDSDGRILFTASGLVSSCDCSFIEIEADDINPLEWRVADGQLVGIPGAALQAAREAASLTKPEFIVGCMSVGLLTPAEAEEAAQGGVPAPFQQAVDALPPYEQTLIRVIWPTATQIDRLDPLILALADGLGVSEHTLDALFGLVEYRP